MDRELMKRIKEGDKEAFEALIALYQQSALAFARRLLSDSYTAEDVVQEAFAYLYVYRDKYNEKYSPKTYLYSIIRHKCIDDFRKKKRLAPWHEMAAGSEDCLEERLLQKEKNKILYKSMDKLKEDYRIVIFLIDYEGFTYKEVCEIMDKNLAQIKILVFRARRKLKGLLEEEGIFHA